MKIAASKARAPRVFVVLPGGSVNQESGGLMVARQAANLIGRAGFRVETATAGPAQRNEPRAVSLEQAMGDARKDSPNSVFILTYGPLVQAQFGVIAARVPRARFVHFAQSFGWGFALPAAVPVVCVSRYVLSQWVLNGAGNYCAYIPPGLTPVFRLARTRRDLDVLVHRRKQNAYCLEELIPALKRRRLRIHIVDQWLPQEELARLLNRTKVFLYVAAIPSFGGVTLPGEGFGLPPLEALACGTIVASNFVGGVTEFLTPGENAVKVQSGDAGFDAEQIARAVRGFQVNAPAARSIARAYSLETAQARWSRFLLKLEADPKLGRINPDLPGQERARYLLGLSSPELALLQRARDRVAALLPPDGTVILVDQGEWNSSEILGPRRTFPFLERHGQYWGPPPDDATAIRELERLRTAGAQFIVFARPAFWWLDYYAGLNRYLDSNFKRICRDEDLAVFDVRQPKNAVS